LTLLDDASTAFRDDPSRIAVTDSSGTWSWTDFETEARRVAAGLDGDRSRGPVLIDNPSDTSFLTRFLAAGIAGRPACTLHQDWAGPEREVAIADVETFEAGPVEDPDDPVFYIGFTSGTSGRPKPFIRRQRSWSSSFEPAARLFGVDSGDRVFLPGSLQHSHFLFGAVFALDRGSSVRLFERFDAGLLTSELQQTPRSVLYLVPTMLLAIDDLGRGPFTGVHSVVVSGAKMEPHHWAIVRKLFPGALVGELYGASELSFVTVNTEGEDPSDPGFVGKPFPGVELEIRPPGVVFVRSPYLFDGYFNGNEIDSPVGPDGFMTVGDMGEIGETGLSLRGRASNLLITGGKNVHPEEVETALSRHPAVAESVVVGVPHPRWGEELVAFIDVGQAGGEIEVESLREYLTGRIARYKIPKRWFVVNAIPRTRAGKTDRSRDRLFDGATEIS